MRRLFQIDTPHPLLQRQRSLVNILFAMQILAVIPIPLLGQFTLCKLKGHIQKERQVGLRNSIVLIFEIYNPLP